MEVAYNLAGLPGSMCTDTVHRDVNKAEIRKSERVVKAALDVIQSFVNPFAVDEKKISFVFHPIALYQLTL